MWQIPAPLEFDWKMRTLADASISVHELGDGRIEHIVKHQPIPGVTPEMLLWYFENIDKELVWRGQRAIGYRFWHPIDHIHFKRHGKLGAGDRWHIVEAFGGSRDYLLDRTFEVLKFDETGFCMAVFIGGRLGSFTDERWEWTPQGLLWTVHVLAGPIGFPFGLIFRKMRPRIDRFLERWHQHNVEEDGNLQHFLPELFASRGR
jgi:hypothetical protein